MNYFWVAGKVIIIYVVLIVILRVLGKREVGQLSIFDLVIILIIADIASLGMDNDEFFLASLLCLLILSILQKSLSLLLLHKAKLRNLVDGSPTIIVYEGTLYVHNMKKEFYTIDDLVSQMRLEHIMDISEIKLAILETNGNLSIIKKVEGRKMILPVILSGQFVEDSFLCIDVQKEAIQRILKNNKIEITRILYASICGKDLIYYYRPNKKTQQIKESRLMIIE